MQVSKNFHRKEFECGCGCGFDVVDIELLGVLQDMREALGAAIIITSGCRCAEYNKKVGGRVGSQHLLGKAADVVVEGVAAWKVAEYLGEIGMGKYGIGDYTEFTHIDVREDESRWERN